MRSNEVVYCKSMKKLTCILTRVNRLYMLQIIVCNGVESKGQSNWISLGIFVPSHKYFDPEVQELYNINQYHNINSQNIFSLMNNAYLSLL